MVKRPKSPDVVEEARYFTVCQPFPLNANWVFDEDQRECATWIAECIGLEHLYAIHYKPSARGMILLEVSKMFTDHERLLGEHRWSEMLTEPDDEEKTRVSQVFHSFYAKGREAQKDGWKNLVVKATWFKNWSPGKGRFKRPYPKTHWCPIPVEDKTNKQLCRPLPVDRIAPPPPRVEPPVVGSTTWIQTKNASKPTAETFTKAWDEDISTIDIVTKLIEPVQPKPKPNGAGIATSVPNESQPNSSLAPSGKNKKKKTVPLNQFINGGGKKANPTWNKSAVSPSASLSPTVKLPLNAPLPKPAPRSANAWDKPIKLPVSRPAATVKKETPPEDYSSWGQEPATSTINQESIWKTPHPTKKKGKGPAIPETPASSTSPKSTQPSSPQVRNIPPISSTTRDVPPHYNFRPSPEEEEEDSDCDDIYVELSKMKLTDVHDLPPEELEYAHVSAWERGDTDAVKPETSEPLAPANESQTYGNLWLSEEDPRAIPLPELICPTHNIACKKGICHDMAKLIRAKKRKELEEKWAAEGKGKKKKNSKRKDSSGSSSGDDKDEDNTAEVDGDNFIIARPKGNRRRFGKEKKAKDTPEVKEPSYIGTMRAFTPDPGSSHADGVVVGGPEPEGQLFTQW